MQCIIILIKKTEVIIYLRVKKIQKQTIKMADLTKNAISVTVRNGAKRTNILDHKGKKSQKINISKIQNFIKKNQNG